MKMADIEREEMIEQAHKLYDNSRNLISELRWQRTYFCRGTNIITKEEKLFNIWIFDECLKRLEERKVGKWIRVDHTKVKCSNCDITHLIAQYPHGVIDYCPNCGADMRGSENGSN